ncbi:MAG: flagellar biosynthesis protein FliQ [Proteobacteria bacterium]|nr:flagellar biosynthesis protein FliQ [Pseudomonadota bacterium]MBU4011272.1 flagellar biosynthesis protein FliQ [Pseudomonadota bacterium]MBU4035922.1 flagellar biosynthesis protein FliQ [Pseudomonadota bacterium]
MSPEFVVNLAQEAIKTTILVSMPILLIALVIGLIISIFQAVTQINEMTLTFVPKILAIFLGLIVFGSWMLEHITTFTINTIEQIPNYIR